MRGDINLKHANCTRTVPVRFLNCKSYAKDIGTMNVYDTYLRFSHPYTYIFTLFSQ